jgi:WD40 repeat protein
MTGFSAPTGWDAQIGIWNPNSGVLLRSLTGHTGWIVALSVAPDATWLTSISDDGTIRAWEPRTSECLAALRVTSTPNAGVIATDSQTVAVSGDRGFYLFRLIKHEKSDFL